MASRINQSHLKALQETTRITFILDKSLHKKFQKKTIDQEVTMTEKLIEWIKDYVKG